MRKIVLAAALMSAAVMVSAPAQAAPILFNLTGADTHSWTIDSASTVLSSDPSSFNITANYDGGFGENVLTFFVPEASQGTSFYEPLGEITYKGDQLFSGPTDAPVFKLGEYDFTGVQGNTSAPAHLSITSGPSAPGPLAGVGLLPALAGAGALFGTRFRRRKPVAA
jgi:hypothetical protein